MNAVERTEIVDESRKDSIPEVGVQTNKNNSALKIGVFEHPQFIAGPDPHYSLPTLSHETEKGLSDQCIGEEDRVFFDKVDAKMYQQVKKNLMAALVPGYEKEKPYYMRAEDYVPIQFNLEHTFIFRTICEVQKNLMLAWGDHSMSQFCRARVSGRTYDSRGSGDESLDGGRLLRPGEERTNIEFAREVLKHVFRDKDFYKACGFPCGENDQARRARQRIDTIELEFHNEIGNSQSSIHEACISLPAYLMADKYELTTIVERNEEAVTNSQSNSYGIAENLFAVEKCYSSGIYPSDKNFIAKRHPDLDEEAANMTKVIGTLRTLIPRSITINEEGISTGKETDVVYYQRLMHHLKLGESHVNEL